MEEQTVQTEAPTTRSVGMRYGLILSLISIVYFLVLTMSGVDMTSGIGRWSSIVFYLAIIYLAQRNFKQSGDGYMSYGQGFGISFWISLISSVIYSVFFYIYVKFIDSSFLQAIKDKQIEAMQQRGMSDADIDRAMQFAGMFTKPEVLFAFSIIGGIIFISICGLIITIFTQNNKPESV